MSTNAWYQKLIRPALWIALLSISAKALQALAGIGIAYRFGATETTDAYLLAKSLPIGAYLVFDSILYNALVPYHHETADDRKMPPGFLVALISGVLISSGLALFGPHVLGLLAPGSSAGTLELAGRLITLMSVGVAFALPASALKAWNAGRGRYVFAALDGFVMSGVLCFTILGTPGAWGIWPVALALPIACGLMLLVQGFAATRGNRGQESKSSEVRQGAGRQVFLAIAAFNVFHQVNMLAVNAFMSGVREGAIAWFNFSYNIAQIPVSVVDLVVMSAFFPFAAALNRAGDRATLAAAYVSVSRGLLMVLIPGSVWLLLTRYDLVQIVFERGVFDRAATQGTALCLAGTALAICPWAFESFGYRCLFALRRHRWYAGIIGVRTAVNVALCVILSSRYGAAGVVVSFCVSYWVGAVLTAWAVAHELREYETRLIPTALLFRTVGASVLVIVLHTGVSMMISAPIWRVVASALTCSLVLAAWQAEMRMARRARITTVEREE